MTTLPIRIAVRVDFSDGSQHEYEVRGQDTAQPLPGFWPAGVVTTDVRKRQEYDQEQLDAIRGQVDTIRRLRQALWDVYAACGEDTHGDTEAPPPGVWTPDIDTLALSAVKLLAERADDHYRRAERVSKAYNGLVGEVIAGITTNSHAKVMQAGLPFCKCGLSLAGGNASADFITHALSIWDEQL